MATCLEDIVNILTSIQQSLAGQGGCGCGSGGGPTSSPPVETADTGDITLPGGSPPAGYDDWAEYQDRKCDIAYWIVSNLLADVQWVLTANLAVLTVFALTAGLIAFISANVLLLILAALIAILAYDESILLDGEAAVVDDFDELVCALVLGTNATESIDDFGTAIDTAVNAETADATARVLLKLLLKYWVDTTSVNLMYEPEENVNALQIPAEGDCSACGLDCETDYTQFGELTGENSWQSEFTSPVHRIRVWIRMTSADVSCGDICGDMTEQKVDTTGWTDAGSAFDNFRFWQDTDCPFDADPGPTVYSSDTAPSEATDYCMRLMDIISGTAFTVELVDRVDC